MLQRHGGQGVWRVDQGRGGPTQLAAKIARLRFERGAGQVQAGIQGAFYLDVKPGLNGARDKLVGHHIDEHAGQYPDQGKDGRQLDEQAATELAAPQPGNEAVDTPDDDRCQ